MLFGRIIGIHSSPAKSYDVQSGTQKKSRHKKIQKYFQVYTIIYNYCCIIIIIVALLLYLYLYGTENHADRST